MVKNSSFTIILLKNKKNKVGLLCVHVCGVQSYWIFLQWIDEQSLPKDGPAVLCHFGLLFGSDGTVESC